MNRVCARCGATFQKCQSQVRAGRGKFCSRACHVAAYASRVHRVCERCGEQFSRCASLGGRFCSPACARTPRVQRVCEICGVGFTATPSAVRRCGARFCSARCRVQYMRTLCGPKSKLWLGPQVEKRWVSRLRAATVGNGVTWRDWREIRRRFSDRCAWCRCDGRLTQDHIVPLSRGGLHQPRNIQPLCIQCNRRKQARTIAFDPKDGSAVIVHDQASIIRAIIAGELPLETVEINWPYVNQLAAAQRASFSIAGLESYETSR